MARTDNSGGCDTPVVGRQQSKQLGRSESAGSLATRTTFGAGPTTTARRGPVIDGRATRWRPASAAVGGWKKEERAYINEYPRVPLGPTKGEADALLQQYAQGKTAPPLWCVRAMRALEASYERRLRDAREAQVKAEELARSAAVGIISIESEGAREMALRQARSRARQGRRRRRTSLSTRCTMRTPSYGMPWPSQRGAEAMPRRGCSIASMRSKCCGVSSRRRSNSCISSGRMRRMSACGPSASRAI